MCSWASFPSRNRKTTTRAISTRMPVGATPGSIQSISIVWVKRMIISSTSWSIPMVRETGTISVSGGILGMKCRE